jgi:hypothetical protein
MKDFIDLLLTIPNLSNSKREALCLKHKRPENIQPVGAFGTFFNVALATIEASNNYQMNWSATAEKERVARLDERGKERAIREKNERLVLITKTMFVWSMSAAEFGMRMAMQMHPTVLPQPKRKREPKFAEMIEASAQAGLITTDAHPL